MNENGTENIKENQNKPKAKPKKQKPWLLKRHKVIRWLLAPAITLLCKIMYNVKVRPFPESAGRPYLILANHQGDFDQFFIGMAIKRPVYYVATEDIFSNGFTSKLIKFLVAPIPIKKGTNNDMNVLRISSRVASEGGTIAIFPEGNRTFSGCTESIKPSIVKYIKLLKLPVAIFRIEGGYGSKPRWSDVRRKTRIDCGVTRVLEYDEVRAMPQEELAELINRELFQDDTKTGIKYPTDKSAEYLERVMYVCPHCGLSYFESKGRKVSCIKCGMTAEYGDDLTYTNAAPPVCEPACLKDPESGIDKASYTAPVFPYRTQYEWYHAQEDFIRQLDVMKFTEEEGPAYEDFVDVFLVHLYERKERLNAKGIHAMIELFCDHINMQIDGTDNTLSFDDTTCISVLGKNKMNIYHNGQIYQIKGDARFNPVKYMHFYYRYQTIKGANDEQFLGL